MSPGALAQLPELITQLESLQAECETLSQTLTINDIEAFAQQMKTLGDEQSYHPLSQWANQLILQTTTFDMDGMAQTLSGYSALITEARAIVENNETSGNDAPTNFAELLNALEAQKSVWKTLSQTLTINEVEDFAIHMQELSQTYNYYPLTEWSEQLALQAATFDMDGIAKTLGSYPVLMEQIQAQT